MYLKTSCRKNSSAEFFQLFGDGFHGVGILAEFFWFSFDNIEHFFVAVDVVLDVLIFVHYSVEGVEK